MDLHYPGFHLRPPSNWINDPNGMIYVNGRYHVFAQYNPHGAVWGNIHWYHFSTKNFLTWDLHPLALTPDRSYDISGCWSGATILHDDKPVIVYSADDGSNRRPALAWGDESLTTWKKDPQNPVITEEPQDDLHGFRDHALFERDGLWYHLIGSGTRDHGLIFCYTSGDLHAWEYQGIWYLHPHPVDNMLECPDYIQFDEGNLLIYSTNDTANDKTLQSYWALGKETPENDTMFEVNTRGLLDGDRLYAPQTMFDEKRHILIGWIREDRPDAALEQAGWAGALSIPRQINVENQQVKMFPLEELQHLRKDRYRVTIPEDTLYTSPDLQGYQLELIIDHQQLGSDDVIQITFSSGQDTLIQYEIRSEEMTLTKQVDNQPEELAIQYEIPTFTRTHLFFDHSIIEVFLNYEQFTTNRIYPSGPEDPSISLSSSVPLNLTWYHLGSLQYQDHSMK